MSPEDDVQDHDAYDSGAQDRVDMAPGATLPGRMDQLSAAWLELGTSARPWTDVRDGRCSAAAALGRMAAAVAPAAIADAGKPLHLDDEYDEHDAFFGVIRTNDHPGAAFLKSSLRIHQMVLTHQRANGCGAADDLAVVTTGWHCLLGYALNSESAQGCTAGDSDDESGLVACALPHEHWRVGHQLFFVLIQGIIVGLRCFIGDRDTPEGLRALRLATEMCLHSAAAMKYAGSLDPADYESDVRPSMLPPAVRPGFSGFQTRDHMDLVRTLRRARPALEELGLGSPAVTGLAAALERVYVAHRLVCNRFDGSKIPSLLMEATGGELATKSGTQIVDQLAARRVGLLRQTGDGSIEMGR